jgi:hypothetical protein
MSQKPPPPHHNFTWVSISFTKSIYSDFRTSLSNTTTLRSVLRYRFTLTTVPNSSFARKSLASTFVYLFCVISDLLHNESVTLAGTWPPALTLPRQVWLLCTQHGPLHRSSPGFLGTPKKTPQKLLEADPPGFADTGLPSLPSRFRKCSNSPEKDVNVSSPINYCYCCCDCSCCFSALSSWILQFLINNHYFRLTFHSLLSSFLIRLLGSLPKRL